MSAHIVITPDDIELINQYATEEVPYYNTIFDEISIDFEGLDCRLLITAEPRNFHAKCYVKNTFIGTVRLKLWSHEINSMVKLIDGFTLEESNVFKKILPKLLNISIGFMYFIDYLSRHRKILFKEALYTYERSQIEDTSNQIIDLNFDSIRYALKEQHKSCGSYHGTWGVKGHYRHYKSGKEIFIKPFTKGTGIKRNQRYRLRR